LSDIFSEVEEEVRRERFAQLWKQYGDYVIAGAALVVIAVAGWQIYQRYETNQRLKASETLIAAQSMSENGAAERANAALGVVAKDAPGGYAKMARLTEAGTLLESGRRDEAIEIYKSIAASDHGPLGKAALIRAGWALSDVSSKPELQTLLAPVSGPADPWRFTVREILAFADYHAHDLKTAEAEFHALANDKEAPDGLQHRAAAMADFVKMGGQANYGSVPKPPPPPIPPAGPALPNGAAPAMPTPPPPANGATPQ
jgi:hypothetical protein